MKKVIILIILILLFELSVIGCTSDTMGDISVRSSSSTDMNIDLETLNHAYAVFLKDLHGSDDNNIHAFTLRDLDNNKVPELIITQQDQHAGNAVLTVYSYNGTVNKLGDYANNRSAFLGGFRFSNDTKFPGLFECWWGGGVEHCGYLYIIEGELLYKDLWYIDRTLEPPQQVELSQDKQLVNESINAYPSYDYSDNLLQLHIVNEDNIKEFLGN